MKAIGYIRVSTEEQAKNGISLDMQGAKIGGREKHPCCPLNGTS